MNIMRVVVYAFSCGIGLCAPLIAAAFPIPGKPIRLVVPFPPGSEAFDGTARILADRLSQSLSTAVIVENRPGAGTVIANQAVASAPPDGHTLLYGVWTAFTMLPHQLTRRPYDELRDFTPITHVARSPLVLLVSPSLPVSNVHELVAYAKAQPAKLSYGSWQFGGLNHVYMEMLKLQAGIDMAHIPYKSPTDSVKDVIEGRIHLMLGGDRLHMSYVQAGKLRAIAATGNKRAQGWEAVPTFLEQGFKGYEHAGGIAIFGPANMPALTVQRLNDDIAKIIRSAEVVDFFTRAVPSFEIEPSTPEALGTFVREQHQEMGAIIRRLGIRMD